MNLNQKIQKYQEIKEQIVAMEKELSNISEEFKAMGSFETDVFNVKISQQSREYLKGIKDVAAVVGRDILDQNNLIGITTYQVIRISEKKKGAA